MMKNSKHLGDNLINENKNLAATISSILYFLVPIFRYLPYEANIKYKICFFIFLIVLIFTNGYAQSPVNINLTNNETDKAFWVSNANFNISKNRAYEKVILSRFILDTYARDPTIDPKKVQLSLNSLQKQFDSQKKNALSSDNYSGDQSPYEVVNSMLNIVGAYSSTSQPATILKEINFWLNKYNNSVIGPEEQILSQSRSNFNFIEFQNFQTKQWENIYDLAHSNSGAETVINTLFGTYLGANTGDSAEKILKQNPDFAQNEQIKKISSLLSSDGKILISLDEIKNINVGQFKLIKDGIKKNQDLLVALNEKKILQSQSEKNKEAYEKQKEINQLNISAVSSGIYLLSTFATIGGDNKLGNSINVIGNSAVQIYKAVERYNDVADRFVNSDFEFGGVILTGNVVGAVLNILSLFSSTEPTPEKIISDQIKELQSQVIDLHKNMNQRFDRIDTGLNKIYVTLIFGLSEIIKSIEKVDTNVEIVRKSAFELDRNLNQLKNTIAIYLQDVARLELKTNLNEIITYKDENSEQMSQIEFFKYSNFLYMWATDFSKNSLEAGEEFQKFEDKNISSELRKPIETNLNYLADYTANLLGEVAPSKPTSRLANFRDWKICSEAYMHLANNWPEHYVKASKKWSQSNKLGFFGLYATGKELQDYINRIVLNPDSSGKKLQANHNFFKSLLNNYKTKASRLLDEFKMFEITYLDGISTQEASKRKANRELNLWKGPAQSTGYMPQQNVLEYISSTINTYEFSLPDNLVNQIPKPYLVAEQLGLGSLLIQALFTWEIIKTYPTSGNGESIKADHKLHTTIKVTFKTVEGNMIPVFSRKYLDDKKYKFEIGIIGSKDEPKNQIQVAWENWGTGKKNQTTIWNKSSQYVTGDTLVISQLVNERLKILQKNLIYSYLIELNKVGSVSDLAKSLDGSKDLLEKFIVLGISQSLENDDQLRSLLYGSEQLPSTDIIKVLFQQNLVLTSQEHESSQDNPLTKLTIYIDERYNLLQKKITTILNRFEERQVAEPYLLIDETQNRLNFYLTLLNKK